MLAPSVNVIESVTNVPCMTIMNLILGYHRNFIQETIVLQKRSKLRKLKVSNMLGILKCHVSKGHMVNIMKSQHPNSNWQYSNGFTHCRLRGVKCLQNCWQFPWFIANNLRLLQFANKIAFRGINPVTQSLVMFWVKGKPNS